MRRILIPAAWLLILLLASTASADVVRILDDDHDAVQARVDLIEQATTDISALYFLTRSDRVTLTALALLREAKRRGVPNVRLVGDANFSRIPKPLLAHLRREGILIRVYHPTTIRHAGWLFRRMHDKVVIVDGRRYITGGRNSAEPYFGMSKKNYVDRDIYVDGDSAADAMRHFEALWSSKEVADLHVRVPEWQIEIASNTLDGVLRHLQSGQSFVAVGRGHDWSDGAIEVRDVRFLHDSLDGRAPSVTHELFRLIGDAKESIVIESPYLVPTQSLRELLEKKASEGVKVKILTNSLRSTDGLFPWAAYLKYRRRLVEKGVQILEYKGPNPLHAKSLVIDSSLFLVGSYNLDPRSQDLNTEVMCVGENEEVARDLLASIEIHLANSWSVGRDGPPPASDHYPGVSRAKSFRAWAARFLMLPFVEKQL